MAIRPTIAIRRLIFFTLVVIGLFYLSPTTQGCGPFFSSALFVHQAHPELPLENFAKGELGVLTPSYARSYLAVAYRYLNSQPLNSDEQQAVRELWQERLDPFNANQEKHQEDVMKRWLDARKQAGATDLAATIELYRNTPTYSTYLNCNEDAFNNATNNLTKKLTQGGASKEETLAWLVAQDQVFSNCAGEAASIPEPIKSSSSATAQADRAYQIAAANFYAGKFDEAERLFQQIAQDKASPWNKVAPYLVARTLVRKATLATPPANANNPDNNNPRYFDKPVMQKAESLLKKILADNGLTPQHPAAQRLLNFIKCRLSPEESLQSFAQTIIKPTNPKNLKQDLKDYTFLLDRYSDDSYEVEFPKLPIKDVDKVRGRGELTDWLATFQSNNEKDSDYAVQKWQQTGSLPWLVCSLVKVKTNNPSLPKLLEAVAKVPSSSPAFTTLAFHKVRLLLEANKLDEARQQLDGILANSSMPKSAHNQFTAQRMLLARDLAEFCKYAQRVPVLISSDAAGLEIPDEVVAEDGKPAKQPSMPTSLLDTDSTKIINDQFPLSVLKEVSVGKYLPNELRAGVVLATWVRAVLLDNEEIGRAVAPDLIKFYPAMKEGMDNYLNSTTPEARKFAAIYLILKFPATRPVVNANLPRISAFNEIDSYRDNWWCSFDEQERTAALTGTVAGDKGEVKIKSNTTNSLVFIDKAQAKQNKLEQEKLAKLGTGPNYLCEQVVQWAKANQEDPRVPEALHLAVKSTRFGCVDDKTLPLSKAAFQVLHKNYPNSDWTKKTPYWFGNK